MSYSELIQDIETKGFCEVTIDRITKAVECQEKIISIKEKLLLAECDLATVVQHLEGLVLHVENNETYIINKQSSNVRILRVIDDDMVYEVLIDNRNSNRDIKWAMHRCNTTKK